MRRKLLTIGLWFAIAAGVGQATAAFAACQIPLVISQSSGDANVLIVLDNSGSMNEALQSSAYNPNTNWSGNFNRSSSYNISTSGNYTPRSFSGSWPSTPSAYLVTSDQGMPAIYYGNYLNWVYFHATAAQRAAIPTVTRIQAAKTAVNTVLAATTGCQFGLMDYQNGCCTLSGVLVAPMGTSLATMQTTVNGLKAETWTPLASTLYSAMSYYSTTGGSAPITAACEQSFVIMVTDGLPTQDTNVPSWIRDTNRNGSKLDEVAQYMYRNDLRNDLAGIQNVATFVIGFNVDDGLLQSTADLGGGAYFSVTDGAGCAAALTSSFDIIQKRIAAGAAVSVVSSENRTDNRLFRARYESQTWRGFVEAFDLPYHSGTPALWEAGSLLSARDPNTRNILSSTTGTNTLALTVANESSFKTLLGAATDSSAIHIIQYARGTDLPSTRSRSGWVLGDIVDPAPLMVGAPKGFNNLSGYQAFRDANASRNEVLYVAANDGMLHCFDIENGSEEWAYVPKNQLVKLQDLMSPTYCHEFFLNMTPAAFDIPISGTWKTLLIGGDERGGNGLFALDVTNPDSAHVSVLWDVDLPTLHGSWNTPTLVHDQRRNTFDLCVGTGYMGTTSTAKLFVMNPANGSLIDSLSLGSSASVTKTTRAASLDMDLDGWDDLLYIADLGGHVWRVDMRTNPWSSSLLFSAGKPIQSSPVVTMNQQGQPMVFFGTGQFLTDSDPADTSQQTFYGVIDDGSGNTVAKSSLTNQTSTFQGITSGSKGWYMDLVNPGERIVKTAALVAGTIYVPSFLPNSAACTGGGQSWLYSLDYKDGSAPSNPNGTENNTTAGRVQSMGDGMLADPAVDLVNEQVLLQSSNAVLLTADITGGLKKLIVRSWRQKLN
jgi:type IV pilus assembly protein PilY1